ncbi:hypothetical protein MAP00_006812 [Monascus purpureus]|nr:hypothetical protein MAP00_006812 [Monascus purpureus]
MHSRDSSSGCCCWNIIAPVFYQKSNNNLIPLETIFTPLKRRGILPNPPQPPSSRNDAPSLPRQLIQYPQKNIPNSNFFIIMAVRVRVPAQLDLKTPRIIGSYVLNAPRPENGHNLVRDPRGEFRGEAEEADSVRRERVRRA